MNFYYYSNEALDYVKSLRKAGQVSQSDIDVSEKQALLTDDVGSRIDAIQLYVFPQGKERLADAALVDFEKPIFQSEISVDQLPVNVVWALKDTRQYLAERTNFSKTPDGGLNIETHMNNWAKKNMHSGRGVAALKKAIKKYTTNLVGSRDKSVEPIVVIYPYVGYLRVTACSQKSF